VTLVLAASLLGLARAGFCAGVPNDTASQEPASLFLVVADFSREGHVTNLGTPYGAWDLDPADLTQSCRIRLRPDEALAVKQPYVLDIDYDVESPNPGANGVWMKLPSIALKEFGWLHLVLRGDPERGYTQRVQLELKGSGRVGKLLLEGIGPEWRRLRIPLEAFAEIRRIKRAVEFVIVFDAQAVTEPTGRLSLAEVAFERKP
jgi:hypothetical protein